MAENLVFTLDVDTASGVAAINTFFNTVEQRSAKAKSKLRTDLQEPLEKQVEIVFEGGSVAARQIESINSNVKKVDKAQKAVNGELGKTPNLLKSQASILQSLLGTTKKYETGTNKVTKEWKILKDRIGSVEREMIKLEQSSNNTFGDMITGFVSVQTLANLATAAVMSVVNNIGELIQTAFRMETLSLQMEAFTGSAEAADAAFEQLIKIAANSPLNLEQVASAAKIMMAFGIETEDAIEATKQLAIVSAATGGDLDLLARNMGQIVAQGRAYTRDLTQFAIQGIPIWEMLSVATGESTVALKDMAAAGQITGTEVTKALELMTMEGSAFAEMAERAQETFQGRFARIEASVQDFAREFILAFNNADRAMFGIISGSMKLFADAISGLADIMGGLVATVATLGAGLTAFGLVMIGMNFGYIIDSISKINSVVKAATAIQAGYNAVMAYIAGMTGQWAAVAAGIAAAAAAGTVYAVSLNNQKKETQALEAEVAQLSKGLTAVTDAQLKFAKSAGGNDLVKKYKDQRKELDGIEESLDRSVGIIKDQIKYEEELFKKFEEGNKKKTEAHRDVMQQATDEYNLKKSNIEEVYTRERQEIQDTLGALREKYGEEIAHLRAKTPAEQKLYDLQKEQIQKKLDGGVLDKEEELSLRARLERMTANEKIQGLMVEQKKEEKELQDKLKELDRKKKEDLDAIKSKYDDVMDKQQRQIEKLEEDLARQKEAHEDNTEALQETVDAAEDVKNATQLSKQAVERHRAIVQYLIGDYQRLKIKIGETVRAIDELNRKTANNLKPQDGAFAGGPVSGGTTYTVNELGKEAFLSASGALSMINAPSWGDWKAPSNGTVIPAHLTRQLDIPKGGVNINKSKASGAAASQGMNLNKLVGMLTSDMGGDNVTNNVTIQSASPNQTASDVLVQLAKLKRLRYN